MTAGEREPERRGDRVNEGRMMRGTAVCSMVIMDGG